MAISELPSAGLGNKLFPWAAGAVFSEVNHCPHFVTGMTRIHVGPWLRGERSKRFYKGYLRNERFFMIQTWWTDRTYMPLSKMNLKVEDKHPFVFKEVPDWRSFFKYFKPHRPVIRQRFWSDITDGVKERVLSYEDPHIAVHIRRGDFRPLAPKEEFSLAGAVRTPLAYFRNVIKAIHSDLGEELPVTVFSDGTNEEIHEILDLPNVERAKDDLDIVHLGVMSRSRCIVTSPGSTFGYWSAFLSDAAIIHHPDHFNQTIRDNTEGQFFEGALDMRSDGIPDLLRDQLERSRLKTN